MWFETPWRARTLIPTTVWPKISFKHVFREANAVADALANMGHGVRQIKKQTLDFIAFLNSGNLLSMPADGVPFTWSNRQERT